MPISEYVTVAQNTWILESLENYAPLPKNNQIFRTFLGFGHSNKTTTLLGNNRRNFLLRLSGVASVGA